MKSVALSAQHYAAKWPTDVVRTPAEMTKLGIEFVDTGSEEKLLEILRGFHQYLLKYVSMIMRGHLPLQRNSRATRQANKDTQLLLRCLIPREQGVNFISLGQACRTLHLAFKGMDADEIYDQLIMCLVKSVKRYDPYYGQKVQATVAILEHQLVTHEKFTASEVTELLGYEAGSYLRVLVKRGHLIAGAGVHEGESQFARSKDPSRNRFSATAAGRSYVAARYDG